MGVNASCGTSLHEICTELDLIEIRRVKCDELKPSCRRCTSTGQRCDGYKPNDNTSSDKAETTDTLRAALTVDVSCDALERRTFAFFCARTVPCLSGYFSDSVWGKLMLQVSHTEPSVRFAINALGALHEETLLRHQAAGNATKGGANSVDASNFRTSKLN